MPPRQSRHRAVCDRATIVSSVTGGAPAAYLRARSRNVFLPLRADPRASDRAGHGAQNTVTFLIAHCRLVCARGSVCGEAERTRDQQDSCYYLGSRRRRRARLDECASCMKQMECTPCQSCADLIPASTRTAGPGDGVDCRSSPAMTKNQANASVHSECSRRTRS
jgi:hypothetical protein